VNRRAAFAVSLLLLTAPAARGETFPVPGKGYALAIELTGCEVDEDRSDPSGSGRYVRAHCPAKQLAVSFWILPADASADSQKCRDAWWRKDPAFASSKDARMRELGDLALVDYMIGDASLQQRNVRAYLAHRDTCVDLHLSRIEQGNGSTEAFDALLRTVRIVEARSSADPSRDLQLASRYIIGGDYSNAAIYYQRVVDQEKQERTLSETEWRVAVDNLAMAYGISGDFDRAEATLRYGIAEDPTYPMFYYNLACTHAEKDDLPNAIAALKKAYALKQNMIEGEEIPDPRSDSSFAKYRTNATFQAALREIGA
jgi:tetratricopeptide (TPR) repeat protein